MNEIMKYNEDDYSILSPNRKVSQTEFNEQIEYILSQFVIQSNCITKEDYQRHVNIIYDAYIRNFECSAGQPEISDIVIDIIEYNWNLVLDIAAIDYYHGDKRSGYHDFIVYQEDKQDTDYISEIAECWYEDYLSSDDNIEEYVEKVLDDHHLYYVRSGVDEVGKMCFNDCQNILLREWHNYLYIILD